ncbi:MAG: hypothetical protein DMG05_10635 [Acidobacteria bacterium]|nr:MAG: hypothetical protein DMG05_10635 [Acidobacteriota bacterium]
MDGDSHFQPREQEKDKARQQLIESTGVHFLRFRNVEVRANLRGLEAIYRKIEQLRKDLRPPAAASAASPLEKGDKA